jgi:hypothetical protein
MPMFSNHARTDFHAESQGRQLLQWIVFMNVTRKEVLVVNLDSTNSTDSHEMERGQG